MQPGLRPSPVSGRQPLHKQRGRLPGVVRAGPRGELARARANRRLPERALDGERAARAA